MFFDDLFRKERRNGMQGLAIREGCLVRSCMECDGYAKVSAPHLAKLD
jgi:hypothetical protein